MKLRNFAKELPLKDLLKMPRVRSCLINDDGSIPNNPRLPLLIYQGALKLPEKDPAAMIEQLLSANNWSGSWRNGIYGYQHYHSTAHEVLVVYAGSATVQFGGEQGISQTIYTGDVVVIPA